MNQDDDTPEHKRDRLRQVELKNNPTGSLHDALNRESNGNLHDLSGGMNWKGTGILIVVLIVGYIGYKAFLS